MLVLDTSFCRRSIFQHNNFAYILKVNKAVTAKTVASSNSLQIFTFFSRYDLSTIMQRVDENKKDRYYIYSPLNLINLYHDVYALRIQIPVNLQRYPELISLANI